VGGGDINQLAQGGERPPLLRLLDRREEIAAQHVPDVRDPVPVDVHAVIRAGADELQEVRGAVLCRLHEEVDVPPGPAPARESAGRHGDHPPQAVQRPGRLLDALHGDLLIEIGQ
jgi:hypothetical protein